MLLTDSDSNVIIITVSVIAAFVVLAALFLVLYFTVISKNRYKKQIKELEKSLEEMESQFTDLLMGIPNAPHASVPLGFDDKANVEVKKWGTQATYNFEVKDHVDLGANLGILDFDRAAKISGSRFNILTGNGARMERALMNFMLDTHTQKHGYREVEPPVIVNSRCLIVSTNRSLLPVYFKPR